jgi:hypothetical protein
MDIEKLTKSQIILLTLLISFVTSIATGIVTVSLLDQAPSSMTRTINKVVERTVERVIPMQAEETHTASAQESVTTVVVKEDDKVAEAIAATTDKIVRIYTRQSTASASSTTVGDVFKGYGIIVKQQGVIATADNILIPGKSYVVKLADNREYQADILVEGKGVIGLMALVPAKGEELALPVVSFANQNTLKLGQTVIQLSGEDRAKVSIGAIAELVKAETKISSTPSKATSTTPTDTPRTLTSIETTITTKVFDGSPLINIFNEIVAIGSDDTFVPVGNETIAVLLSGAAAKEAVAKP